MLFCATKDEAEINVFSEGMSAKSLRGGKVRNDDFDTPPGRIKGGEVRKHTSHTPVDPRGVGGCILYIWY